MISTSGPVKQQTDGRRFPAIAVVRHDPDSVSASSRFISQLFQIFASRRATTFLIQMFAQSTKFNRQETGEPGRTRDRSAPMDFAFEKPRDPGVFGAVPHKRRSARTAFPSIADQPIAPGQHIETLDGQSTWTPGPFSEPPIQAPFTHAGPMLFAHPTSAKEQDAGDVSMGMDVDMSMREDQGDVDMYSDSPAKIARNVGPANEDKESVGEATSEDVSTKPTSSLLESVLRPINGNAVKRVEKQRSKAPHAKNSDRNAVASARQENALVLRDDDERDQAETEETSGDEDDVVSILTFSI
jgi:hypothetical protein